MAICWSKVRQAGQDRDRSGAAHRGRLPPHPVHARSAALGPDRTDIYRPQEARFEFEPGRSYKSLLADEINRARRKCSRHCWKRWASARSPSVAPRIRCRCSGDGRRTRSSRKVPIPARPSWIASDACASAIRCRGGNAYPRSGPQPGPHQIGNGAEVPEKFRRRSARRALLDCTCLRK